MSGLSNGLRQRLQTEHDNHPAAVEAELLEALNAWRRVKVLHVQTSVDQQVWDSLKDTEAFQHSLWREHGRALGNTLEGDQKVCVRDKPIAEEGRTVLRSAVTVVVNKA